jgi:PilZ domain
MVETRIELRHRVVKAGTIEFGSSSINCMVRNLSTTGAALEVSNQIGIAAKFTLVIPEDGLHLSCNVVRRSGYRIGVAFDQAVEGALSHARRADA